MWSPASGDFWLVARPKPSAGDMPRSAYAQCRGDAIPATDRAGGAGGA